MIRAVAEQALVSFLDLISLRAVAALRTSGPRLQQIRAGAEYIREVLGIDYPRAKG